MNEQSRETLNSYYAEGESWTKDRQGSLRRSRRVAWIVAGAAAVVAVCEAFALMLLTPLKTVEPYTLMVDRQTGFVQLLKPLQPEQISADTALTQSFLVQYVIARESFDINALDKDYRKVALWSAATARSDYLAYMPVSNPDSPLVLYPRTTTIETRVKSVSSVGQDTAMVRFETVRRDAGGQAQPPRAWVSIIRYRYSGEPMRAEDRYLNPLGFQIVHYRRDAEALPAAPEPQATTEPDRLLITPRALPIPRPSPTVASPAPQVEL
ncbi:MAG: type IV secretion system protein [Sphingomonadales bacterium]|nr:MAG: type IV secretion system protein [Sphingomonadales bacterium]